MRSLLLRLMILVLVSCLHRGLILAESKALQPAWELELRGDTPQGIIADAKGRPYLFVTLKTGGFAVLKTGRGREVAQVVARIGKRELSNLDAMHLSQRGNRLYVALGDLFAAQGDKAGLAVIDVAAPATPKVLGSWTSPAVENGAAVIVADDNHAYLGAMSSGVMIFNVEHPGQIKHISTFRPDPNFPRANPNRVQRPELPRTGAGREPTVRGL